MFGQSGSPRSFCAAVSGRSPWRGMLDRVSVRRNPFILRAAKSIIYLYMEGGPSQVDTFDFKPELQRRDGEALPFQKPATVFNSSAQLMKSPFSFRRCGESGSWVSRPVSPPCDVCG